MHGLSTVVALGCWIHPPHDGVGAGGGQATDPGVWAVCDTPILRLGMRRSKLEWVQSPPFYI